MDKKSIELYYKKIAKIRNYFKKDKMYLELSLMNYEGYYLYFTINYLKKSHSYKLSWFDLDVIDENNIEKYVNYQYLDESTIDKINEDFSKFIVSSESSREINLMEGLVLLKANIKTKVDKKIDVAFNKYLPKNLAHLSSLFILIFNYLPRILENILFELLADLTGSINKYEYKKEFAFDLFNDDIDKIFAYQIIERGKKYYDEHKVIFLEKIEDRYFAIVEGNEKYVVVIKYDEENKIMQVYCSCPCEFYCKHIYAVILSIRNNEESRFYKISYKNPNENILDRIMNFHYFLCLGIVEQNFEIINDYGETELVPILDKDDKYNWDILEDSEDERLLKEVQYFLNNN